MRTLTLDLETYSSINLTECGVYAYSSSSDFEILLLAYAFDDGEVEIIDIASGEQIPSELHSALTNPEIIKTAFNANFERTCLARYFRTLMPPEQWRCSQAHSLTLGLPASLEGVAKCMNLSQQKISEGKGLIRYFSTPCKPTKANNGRTRNLPKHDLVKWEQFKTYCKQDVEVEQAIRKKLERYPMPEKEIRLWCLDQKTNDLGVRVDMKFVQNAIYFNEAYQKKLIKEAKDLTGLDNPNSPAQLKTWLNDIHEIKVESLSKDVVSELLKETHIEDVKHLLKLRQDMSKTSVKKYEAMKRVIRKDERAGGLLKYYGASRTGRWAGRLIQIQNLPRNSMEDLHIAREILKAGNYETMELLFDSVPDTLSQLIRTAFIPSPGCRFIVSDFSSIEARIIAWLAGEKWVVETFKGHGKIYEMAASRMFGVPLEKIVKGNPEYELRAKGKIATLACGYQGSVGALIAMGALKMGLKEEELPEIVAAWRNSNPNIVKLWWNIEKAAIKSVKEKTAVTMQYGLKFYYKSGMLFIRLPSGRSLAYVRPRIEIDTRFNKEKLTYEGVDQTTKNWGRISTYGGRLVENCVQAIARDCLAEALLRLDEAGYKVVMHCHDEVVLDVPQKKGSLDKVNTIMCQPIKWAPGLPMQADGFETEFYKKD
ncbi:phage encoded DNA polymerase I [Candidatus Syntrophocurvum alkaliphilum]|uniref:DNA-directed DNA polymerase n=1 Tax=Candidatus Syntrophocurvum alkaliphilum TaxID=2293317 RepID=A0A6I6D9F4_9FIRM|nr:DNA polymerase [Candidatus Syntrophocurvum alkaliphilum]QGT99528.1 phage encoded DNA polymerase I [Candidatus Syntrophocurvum alkaliphilum]